MSRFRASGGAALLVLCISVACLPDAQAGTRFDLVQTAGGIAIATAGPNYQSAFGTVDALAINTGAVGMSRIATNTGALYYSPYQISIHANGLAAGHHGYVTAYVRTNFTHPAALVVYTCPSGGACTTSGSFSAMSTNVAAQSVIVPTPGLLNSGTTTASIAVWVPDNNGATAFSGTDSVITTFSMIDFETGATRETFDWRFNLAPAGVTLQTAVRLTLASNISGATIVATGGTPDYTLNFGNVNGAGIAPGAGFTTTAVAGGVMYATPYDLTPSFTDFTSTTGTVRVTLTTAFAHPTILQPNDAPAATGPFTQITATPITIQSNAASRATFTRYLALFVSNVSGGSAFTGADTARLTFTLVVP
jgi:hypothetical protein